MSAVSMTSPAERVVSFIARQRAELLAREPEGAAEIRQEWRVPAEGVPLPLPAPVRPSALVRYASMLVILLTGVALGSSMTMMFVDTERLVSPIEIVRKPINWDIVRHHSDPRSQELAAECGGLNGYALVFGQHRQLFLLARADMTTPIMEARKSRQRSRVEARFAALCEQGAHQ